MSTNPNVNNSYYRRIDLPAGDLHVFAHDDLFHAMGAKVLEMANNNLQIPNIRYMSYTPDAHVGVGTCIGTTAVWGMRDGFVSPSIVGSDIGCGMRVHLTNLQEEDLQDVKLRRKLVKAIEKRIPVENHARGYFSDIRLEDVVRKGLHGLPGKYVPDSYTPKKATSLTHVECSRFRFDEGELDRLPEQVIHRAHRQLGTLGNGNHFIEIQALRIHEDNRHIAEQWGIRDGQVAVMIHSGSRSWGGSVNQYCISQVAKTMSKLKLGTADPKLVYAPLDSEAGQTYMNLMYSALNYATVNRHLMAFAVRDAFKETFGSAAELSTLYDLMHNYACEESFSLSPGFGGSGEEEELFIHRKGTTRALPAGHPDNPAPYQATGHPALIPGSMGTASYIMVGAPEGARNYHSICHGAGRVRSRNATKQLVTVDEFASSMRIGQDDEVVLNHRGLESLIDESPQAYKDVDQIIDSVVEARLASVVAKCRPLAAVKGV
ncbi:tRNA-splicing ligase RtcB [Paenibacillus taihuensis]|uniref:tRNA-splicing ligase RtcB n=1 Tax=Paenibacillus taihuensis TaxID=1156355 RepID=A0A3D9SBP1_9BACL|nr:RtcB family protein [Paenibacillus taihuensis]REE91297.1 tRNA-splicing ligase RtcB [Paenibacillus taihuensis]